MTAPARRAGAAAACVVALCAGCSRTVDDPQAKPASLAAPITTLQVADLLSPQVIGEEGNLFAIAEPERCSGLAREVDPPLIQAQGPLATDGGHWTTEDGQFYIEEMVAVYRSDFDSGAALDTARRTLDECRDATLTVTTMQERVYEFDVEPAATDGPAGSLLWSLRAIDWNCDNLFVAAHNAAIEITTCGTSPGFDVAGLAEEALDRVNALANTTA